jgi:phosphoserine aminotransferase
MLAWWKKASRSRMNVVFRVAGGDDSTERKFAAEALTNFMHDFQRTLG